MKMTPEEHALWDKNKAFFSPSGTPDSAAFEAYFKKYGLLKNADPGAPQQTLLGVLLKHAPDATFETYFAQYYEQFRTSYQSTQFDEWLGDVAATRPQLLARTFKSAAPLLNFTDQVMILRDVQRWFPGSAIKEYATPKLLKTKPTVILKQFAPALVDMPYLLDMSVSLMNDSDAQSKALGDTIVRGCFIARYGMPAMEEESPGLTKKYCSIAAFSMLVHHGLTMAPGTLLQQVQLRYNAQSVMFDALAYCERVLSTPSQSPAMQANALETLAEILTFSENNLGHKGFDDTPMHALIGCYPWVDEPMQTRIQTHLRDQMFFNNAEALLNVLTVAAHLRSPLVKPLSLALLDKVPFNEKTSFLHLALFNEENDEQPLGMLAHSHLPTLVKDALFEQVAPAEIADLVRITLRLIFNDEDACSDDTNDKAGRTHRLKDVLECMAALQWSEEQRVAFQHSPQAATALLLYMYSSATGARHWPEPVHSNGVPNTDWMPLPVLTMLYPEQMPVWSRMTIELLNMPVPLEQENSDKQDMQQYMNVMAAMYNLLAQTFLENAPSFLATQGLIESLGVGSLEYFEGAQHKKEPMVQWELPENMFSFDGS